MAVVLFALAMFVLVWILQRHEAEIERNALMRDVQWADQTIQTHFIANERFLAQLARDIAIDEMTAETFQARANQYLANNLELLNIVWIDASGAMRWAAPLDTEDWLPGDVLSPTQGQIARLARELGRAAYGLPYRTSHGTTQMEVVLPVNRGRSPHGFIVAEYSIEGLLRHLVSPWFSEKYYLRLIDGTGETLVANAASPHINPTLSPLIVFDPPGNGLALRVAALNTDTSPSKVLPIVLIVGLSVLVFWSLWALRSHIDSRTRAERERDQLFDVSLDMLCTLTMGGAYRRVNPACERTLGYPSEQLVGHPLYELVHPDDQADMRLALARLADGAACTFEARVRCADGSYKWLVWNANPVPNDQVIYAVAHDITKRKATEEAWRAESAFRKAMEQSVRTGLRATDLHGCVIYANPAFCDLVGYKHDEIIGLRVPFPYWPDEDVPRNMEIMLAGKIPPEGEETRIQRKDGRQVDVQIMISPLIDSAGVQTGWMTAMSDITESKRIRAELEAAQERFVAVLDGLDTAVYVADARTDSILYANRALLANFGAHALGSSTYSLSLPQPERGDYPVDPRHLQHDALPFELFDGELQQALTGRWYHVRERATRWVDGRIVRMVIATDITDRKQVAELNRQQEERLQQTSRLITLGEMASTLAHELNQPLSAIANYSSGCVNRLQSGRYKPEELLSAMQKTSHQADRAGKILRRIRDFVRKSEPRLAAIQLADVVEDALGFAEIDARKYGVRIDNEIPSALPAVHADRIMIEQVVLNLVRNAAEAMHATPGAERVVKVHALLKEQMLEVSVSDRGHGVSAEDRDKLFTAFYTTKPDGMGMGLNICRSIIEFHNGRLWAEDNPGGGCIFRFTLPLEHAFEHHAEPA